MCRRLLARGLVLARVDDGRGEALLVEGLAQNLQKTEAHGRGNRRVSPEAGWLLAPERPRLGSQVGPASSRVAAGPPRAARRAQARRGETRRAAGRGRGEAETSGRAGRTSQPRLPLQKIMMGGERPVRVGSAGVGSAGVGSAGVVSWGHNGCRLVCHHGGKRA